MATYFLSSNPVIANFTTSGATLDNFINDVGPASGLLVLQSGTDTVITNGVNTATLQNFSIDQVSVSRFTSSDGSKLQVGDGSSAINANSADTFTGTSLGDFFLGLGGNDVAANIVGNDALYGNQGDDTFTSGANAGQATIYGGQGIDTINFNTYTGTGLLFGNIGNDVFTGSGAVGNNTVFGGQDNDQINFNGATGANQLFGNLGEDVIVGGSGADSSFGGQGADRVSDTGGNNFLFGNIGNDTVSGGGDNDTIYGGQDNDLLFGFNGNDFVSGDLGNDTIQGNIGSDTLTGGAGADVFSTDFNLPVDAGNTSATADTITDFVTGTDKLNFTGTGSVSTTYTEFQGGTVSSVEQAVQAYAASVLPRTKYTFIAGATDGYLIIDKNTADAAADGVLVLKGGASQDFLTASDITTVS
ncbi:calcium-binding protein [Methylobacterium sp. A54F]